MFALKQLGWAPFFDAQLTADERATLAPARVAEEQKQLYRVWSESGEWLAEIAGRLRHTAATRGDLPAVGDWVLVRTRPRDGRATIRRVLERRTRVSRRVAGDAFAEQVIAANLDTVFVTTSLDRDFSLRRIERYLAVIHEGGARPVILLTKPDLAVDPRGRARQVESAAAGSPVHLVCGLTGEGLDRVEAYLEGGRTGALVGSSGVGKSTIVNALMGRDVQRVRDINDASQRGRHTTTARQLILLPRGGLLIDTPGMRELQILDTDDGLARTFEDINTLAASCRFRDCRHRNEPGCVVRQAVEDGRLEEPRLESYRKLERESRHAASKHDARKRLDVKRTVKEIDRAQKRMYRDEDRRWR